MTLAPVVRPYRRWRRRVLVLAIAGGIAGGYQYTAWLNSGHCWTYPELNQRRLEIAAAEAAAWTLRNPRTCPRLADLFPDLDDGRDMYGRFIEIACDNHDTVLVHSSGPDRVFRTPDDQISARSPLTPIARP